MGFGKNKKTAKNEAAFKILSRIKKYEKEEKGFLKNHAKNMKRKLNKLGKNENILKLGHDAILIASET